MTTFTVRVQSNAVEVAQLMERVGRQINKQATNAASRGALLQLRTKVLAEAARDTGVPQRILRKRFYIKRRNPRAMFIGTRPVPVIHLGARELAGGRRQRHGKGVSFRGPGGRERLPRSFIAKGLGKEQVFERETQTRLPLDVQTVDIHTPIERSVRVLVGGTFLPRKFEEIYAREFNFRTNREIERMRARTVEPDDKVRTMPEKQTYVVVDPETKRRKRVSAEEAQKIHEHERKARAAQIAKDKAAKKAPAPAPLAAQEGGDA